VVGKPFGFPCGIIHPQRDIAQWRHFAVSLRMKRAKSAGEPGNSSLLSSVGLSIILAVAAPPPSPR